MKPDEVVNHILKVLDATLSNESQFTGKIEFEVNCKDGGIGSVNAIEKKIINI